MCRPLHSHILPPWYPKSWHHLRLSPPGPLPLPPSRLTSHLHVLNYLLTLPQHASTPTSNPMLCMHEPCCLLTPHLPPAALGELRYGLRDALVLELQPGEAFLQESSVVLLAGKLLVTGRADSVPLHQLAGIPPPHLLPSASPLCPEHVTHVPARQAPTTHVLCKSTYIGKLANKDAVSDCHFTVALYAKHSVL